MCFAFSGSPIYADTYDFPDKVVVGKLFINNPNYAINFTSRLDDTKLEFEPHFHSLTGVSLAFKDIIGIGYGFRNAASDEDIVRKGKTDYDDFRFTFAYESFSLDLNFQSYRGFYLKNTRVVDPSWTAGQPYHQLPEMKLENFAANFIYIWSPDDFSIAAVEDHTLRQTRSGGSFLLGGDLSRTAFSNPDGLFPTAIASRFGSDQNLTDMSFMSLAAKIGYGYNFIFFEKWYLGASVLGGAGLNFGRFKSSDETSSKQDVTTKADVSVSFGFNGDNFISGSSMKLDSTSYHTDSTEVNSLVANLKFFIGGRF